MSVRVLSFSRLQESRCLVLGIRFLKVRIRQTLRWQIQRTLAVPPHPPPPPLPLFLTRRERLLAQFAESEQNKNAETELNDRHIALGGFSQCLIQEVAFFNIRILVVQPGAFSTNMLGGIALTEKEMKEEYRSTVMGPFIDIKRWSRGETV